MPDRRFFRNPHFSLYIHNLVTLHAAMKVHGGESAEAESVREAMDSREGKLNSREIGFAAELSAFLYELDEKYDPS